MFIKHFYKPAIALSLSHLIFGSIERSLATYVRLMDIDTLAMYVVYPARLVVENDIVVRVLDPEIVIECSRCSICHILRLVHFNISRLATDCDRSNIFYHRNKVSKYIKFSRLCLTMSSVLLAFLLVISPLHDPSTSSSVRKFQMCPLFATSPSYRVRLSAPNDSQTLISFFFSVGRIGRYAPSFQFLKTYP